METLVQQVVNGLAIAMLLYIVAAGVTLLFGLGNVLALSHGATFIIGAYTGWAAQARGVGFFLACLAAVVVGVSSGLLLYGLSMKIRSDLALVDRGLVLLGVGFIVADLVVVVWGGGIRSQPPPPFLAGSVEIVGMVFPTYRLAVAGMGLLTALVLYLFIQRTRVGIILRAGVWDADMVQALGIRFRALFITVFVAAIALSSLTGVLASPIMNIYPGLDFRVLSLALIIVIIGGLGSLAGAFAASILVGLTVSLGAAMWPAAAAALPYAVMVIVLTVKPTGLAGRMLVDA